MGFNEITIVTCGTVFSKPSAPGAQLPPEYTQPGQSVPAPKPFTAAPGHSTCPESGKPVNVPTGLPLLSNHWMLTWFEVVKLSGVTEYDTYGASWLQSEVAEAVMVRGASVTVTVAVSHSEGAGFPLSHTA